MIRSAVLATALVGPVSLANWLVQVRARPAGFGLLVPAETHAAELALGLRDALYESCGMCWVLGAIAAGKREPRGCHPRRYA